MPEPVRLLVNLNGIKYEEEEAKSLLETVLERNNVLYDSVQVFSPTEARSTKVAKKKKTTAKKTTKKKRPA